MFHFDITIRLNHSLPGLFYRALFGTNLLNLVAFKFKLPITIVFRNSFLTNRNFTGLPMRSFI
jgi:hypothetical protein